MRRDTLNCYSPKERMSTVQISLTKKLSSVAKIKPGEFDESIDPLFCWTANWTNTFADRKEDMVVLVNQANRFTVAIYGIRRNQFKNIEEKMIAAIKNTFLAMNYNPELVEEYLRLAGEVTYAVNRDPKMTACMNRQGFDAAAVVGRTVNDSRGDIAFIDTLGSIVSRWSVNYGKSVKESFIPAKEMIKALPELTGKPAYRYPAFELLVTLDLEIYQATRRLIVPSGIEMQKFHKVLQKTFDWEDYHLYDFAVYDEKSDELSVRLVPDKESLDYGPKAKPLYGCKLSDYLPGNKLIYTYDMGDNWQHSIELVRTIDEFNEDSPYLLESKGQTPPEDVGGVGGFLDFREIMLNPEHPGYNEAREWSHYWTPELSGWKSRPGFVDVS